MARERIHIELNDCVNKVIPGRTTKEYRQDNKKQISKKKKEHYNDNREQILQRNKEFYTDNKEQILEQMKEYYNEYMANKPGWPQRTKTIWEKISCNINRHTDCPEDFKVPPLLEPLTGAAVTGATVTGGYEKYINNPRKTKRKRLVKKGKRKNKTYHRRVSV
jgi:hypothetical protein